VVPLGELRRLRAAERRASAEVLEEAEIEATLAKHREWFAAGRPALFRTRRLWPSCSAITRIDHG
jgi:hypothetical protein